MDHGHQDGHPGFSLNGRENDCRPLADAPVPLDEMAEWNFYYLNVCAPQRDPTIVWGTDVDCGQLQDYLRELNQTSDTLVTPAHLLVAATGRALAKHPQFNRRILRGRLWDYRATNVVMPFRSRATRDINVMFLGHVDRKSVSSIAAEAWHNAQSASGVTANVPRPAYMRLPRRVLAWLQPFHVWLVNTVNLKYHGANHRQRGAATMVNYLGHRGMAPLRSFKPSRLPYESVTLTVTMGAIEERPAVIDGQVVPRRIAPLFLRADHRLVDAHEIGAFAETLRELLADPNRVETIDHPGTDDRRPMKNASASGSRIGPIQGDGIGRNGAPGRNGARVE